jgi:leucine dehydrogenase
VKLFETIDQMGHEQVLFYQNTESGLKAIIALHDTGLGVAMGATRMFPYANEADALNDVLRLSRGMTYKAACANIPVGGAKAVIISNPQDKTEAMLRDYGRFVESLQGIFVTGQDVNLSPQDVRLIGEETRHVVGLTAKSIGPAPITAMGVFLGIKAALEFKYGDLGKAEALRDRPLSGIKVAVQGLGNVGQHLCDLLYQQGVQLFVSDISREKTWLAQRLYNATVVAPQEIYTLDVDVFAPCALGGILNSSTIPLIKAPIIAGCANNQLQDEAIDSQALTQKGILYCPDYVINSGGLIDVYNEMIGYQPEKVKQQLNNIYITLQEIFTKAQQQNLTTNEAAFELAKTRIAAAKNSVNDKNGALSSKL